MNLNKSNPLVSIITPTYNSEKYIKETANSIISQTITDWEWLVVDDCSSDTTRLILNNFAKIDERIKPIFLNENSGGPAKPRNIGLDEAKGKYVCFLDSDDVWLKNKLKEQVNNIDGFDGICSNFSIIDAQSKVTSTHNPWLTQLLFTTGLYKRFVIYLNPININTTMIRNNTSLRFEEHRDFAAIEDWVFWIEYLSDNKKFKFQKEVLINYRIHEGALSSWSNIKSYSKIINYLNFARKEKRLNLFQSVTAKFAVYFKILLRRTKIFFKNGK